MALRVRGYRNRANLHSYRTIGAVTGALLVRGWERGERVGHAMRCRGFDGRFRSLSEFRTTAADVLMFLPSSPAARWAFVCWTGRDSRPIARKVRRVRRPRHPGDRN